MARARNSFDGTDDDRAVSEVIGSILVFGLLIALLALVQTQVVPNANQDIEAQHNAELQGDMSRLSEAISRSAAAGTGEAVSVSTGTTYPQRLVLYNPGSPPTGRLAATDGAGVFLLNVSATEPEARDYVLYQLGTQLNTSMNTSRLVYDPEYNRYTSAPRTAIEYNAIYNEQNGETLLQSTGPVVDGKTIDLTLLGDGLQSSGQLTTTVRTRAVSTGPGLPVRGLGDYTGTESNLTIQLPTRMNESVWTQEILADEIDDPADGGPGPEGAVTDPVSARDTCAIPTRGVDSSFGNATDGNDRYIYDCTYIERSSGPNYIQLKLESNTVYQFRTTKVGFAADSPRDPAPRYVVPIERTTTVESGDRTDLSVEVRDRYNNPVSGVELIANVSAGPTGATLENGTGTRADNVTVTTGEDGQATVTFESGTGFGSSAVTFKGDFDGDGVRGTVNPLTSTASTDRVPENTTVVVRPAGTKPEPVRFAGASIVADDRINVTVRNAGPDRQVTDITLNHVAVHDRKQAVNESNLVVNTFNTALLPVDAVAPNSSVSVGFTNVTNIADGPEAVTEFGVNGSVSPLGTAATENGGPVYFARGTFPAINRSTTGTLTFEFDEAFRQATVDNSLEEGDAVVMSVTVTYDDNRRGTYRIRAETPEDDDR